MELKSKTFHPTQKLFTLFEYLIKTYTNKGDLVLDNCMGSCTTALAADNTGRNWIGFELDKDYCNKGIEWINVNREQLGLPQTLMHHYWKEAMSMIQLTISGKPVSAVRMTQKSMYKNKYAQRYLAYKKQVGWIAKQHMKDKPIEGHVGVKLTHYINGNRADIDNLFKGVTDALNKIVYKDDWQVKQMEARIIPCEKEEQRTEIVIYELDRLGNIAN
ncbi:RusA family crossover junction endodeoxyribonuclease [Virgibacillus sp. AGTR]|uniref:RusA family crossover junction endodeoxyribonuclease n=1 Tax=Virgibacillus sp. AGTR TaxID=2812055 RepID=UPI0027DFC6F6|nr:DNA methyltransferase [Virgibacillus sp. AGTR]